MGIASYQPALILVLEDEPTQRELLVASLACAGFRPSAAGHVSKALQLAEHQQFDLVIADYYLPDLSGADFVVALREHEEYQRTPVILLTARTKELNLDYLRNELQVLVVSKPVDMGQLLDTISRALALVRSSC